MKLLSILIKILGMLIIILFILMLIKDIFKKLLAYKLFAYKVLNIF
jgi:hypothetical protein